jgi:probable rRNA maturation factor
MDRTPEHNQGSNGPRFEDAPRPLQETLRVDLIDGTGRLSDADLQWIGDHAAAAGQALRTAGELRVRVVADAEMASAHEEYTGVAGTTDVLTFDLGSEPDGQTLVLDVDIMACLDEAERQGAARGHEPRREILLYVIHGVLHCLGHDDHDDAASAAMHAEEDRVLGLLGVGATFSRPEGGQMPGAEGGGGGA